MDTNLLYWQTHGQSFLSRLKIWADLLDPVLLLSTQHEVEEAHSLLGSDASQQNQQATHLSLSSVHAASGTVLPLAFRPPALLPLCTPVVMASFLPHTTVRTALLCQFPVQFYMAGFTQANRSSLEEKMPPSQTLLMAGTVTYATCAGALPQIIINRLGISAAGAQSFLRNVCPIPISAALAAFSVYVIRNQETEDGIQVFDGSGNLVGVSPAAGRKAVKETALSRAVMFGTTAAVPQLLVSLLKRTRRFQKSPRLLGPLRTMGTMLVFQLMIPVSLSLFPQLGTIKTESLEQELSASSPDSQLYYHRGL
ncbi:sideroflexin-4 [Synchiropus splendidus]|uniref:sideroflexin-4 n=1 Tax=Synchiropus splendidus TaxID=270530 RepID=UPI00237D506A|nr:sideroflexin-4 [Synchiropus splendidus]